MWFKTGATFILLRPRGRPVLPAPFIEEVVLPPLHILDFFVTN